MSVFITWLFAVLLLSGCADWVRNADVNATDEQPDLTENVHKKPPVNAEKPQLPKKIAKKTPVLQIHGNGIFVKAKTSTPTSNSALPKAGDITLNFENTDIREVVKTVLSDLLGVNYILDPAVQGSVTMETGRPLTRDLLLPTLETMLRMNKAALVYKDGMYYVMPIAAAIQGTLTPQLGDTAQPLPGGYSVRIVPLKYIGATEMAKILKPLAPDGSVIRIDPVRNLLVLAGSSQVLTNLLDTIDTFDVNWIKGLSVGLFKIQHSSVKDVMKQIGDITSGKEDNPLAGMFRVVPIEAANSLLVVTHQQEYLDQIGAWIARFDQAGEEDNGNEPMLYVYRVKHGEASNLADMLGQLFSDGKSQAGNTSARVAPGMHPGTIGTSGSGNGSLGSSFGAFGSSNNGSSSQNGLSNNSMMGSMGNTVPVVLVATKPWAVPLEGRRKAVSVIIWTLE